MPPTSPFSLPNNDRFKDQYGQQVDPEGGLNWPATEVYDVTALGLQSDTVDLPLGPCRGIYIGGAGTVTLIDAMGNTAVQFTLSAGSILPVRASRIKVTGSTATAMLVLY